MVVNKRNKIKLPFNADPQASQSLNKLNKERIGLFPDDDDYQEEEVVPIPILKRNKRKITNDVTDNAAVETRDYSSLFKSKPKMKILNLDDMSDDEDDDDESHSVPTREEIENLKLERIRNKNRPNRENAVREKEYVALLDKEDKADILETMKKQGGVIAEDDVWAEKELPNDLEDERLVLTAREKMAHDQRKRLLIEDALKEQQNNSPEEWESQLLNKSSTTGNLKLREEPALPKLYSFAADNNDDALQTALCTVRTRSRQLTLQVNALAQQRRSMEEKKGALISHIMSLDVA